MTRVTARTTGTLYRCGNTGCEVQTLVEGVYSREDRHPLCPACWSRGTPVDTTDVAVKAIADRFRANPYGIGMTYEQATVLAEMAVEVIPVTEVDADRPES